VVSRSEFSPSPHALSMHSDFFERPLVLTPFRGYSPVLTLVFSTAKRANWNQKYSAFGIVIMDLGPLPILIGLF